MVALRMQRLNKNITNKSGMKIITKRLGLGWNFSQWCKLKIWRVGDFLSFDP